MSSQLPACRPVFLVLLRLGRAQAAEWVTARAVAWVPVTAEVLGQVRATTWAVETQGLAVEVVRRPPTSIKSQYSSTARSRDIPKMLARTRSRAPSPRDC